jgi:outer membrane protein
MKKIVLATMIATSFSMADFIGGELNLGYYSHSPSGTATYDGDRVDIEDDLKWDGSEDIFLKAYLEHPIPIVPNIKIGYSAFSHDGEGSVSERFSWRGINFAINDNVDTSLDLNIYDIALYYEILDNWLNLDLGVNIKYIDGSIDVKSTTKNEHQSFQAPIPMLYAKARFDVPTTDFSFQVEGNYISDDSNTLYDLEIGARYTLALGLGFEAGYKSFKLKLDDIDDLSMDTDFNGLYGKVVWDF